MKSVVLLFIFAVLVTGTATVAAAFTEAERDSVGQKAESGPSKQEIKDELARIASSEVPGDTEWERGKSARTATLCSMVLPGLGQLYNGRRLKVVLAAGGFGYLLGRAWLENKQAQEYLLIRDSLPPGSIPYENANILYDFHKESSKTFVWWSGAVWLIQVLDAFVDAHLYDVRAVTPIVMRGADDTQYLALSFDF